MSKNKLIKIDCPGCGKDLHSYTIPSQPGTYRVMCQGDRTKKIELEVNEDGTVKPAKKK